MANGLATPSALGLKAANGRGLGGSIRPPGDQVEEGIIMNTFLSAQTMA